MLPGQSGTARRWSWPKQEPDGPRSSNSSPVPIGRHEAEPSTPDPPESRPQPDDTDRPTDERSALRVAIVGLIPSVVTLAVSFGLPLTGEQQALVTTIAAGVTAVVMAARRARRRA